MSETPQAPNTEPVIATRVVDEPQAPASVITEKPKPEEAPKKPEEAPKVEWIQVETPPELAGDRRARRVVVGWSDGTKQLCDNTPIGHGALIRALIRDTPFNDLPHRLAIAQPEDTGVDDMDKRRVIPPPSQAADIRKPNTPPAAPPPELPQVGADAPRSSPEPMMPATPPAPETPQSSPNPPGLPNDGIGPQEPEIKVPQE